MNSKRFLYFAVFISGMTTLAIELSASRLLGSVFGTSNLVWANVIGLMLLYLTIGYFIGGRWADRSPYHKTLYRIMLWAAFLSALVPLVARPILQGAALAVTGVEAGLALGSFISVLILFSVPVTLLGCISPFAIRLAVTKSEEAGRVSGQIYAISTLGSLLGTFLPTLILIPELGTALTFLFFSGCLYGIAFIGLWSQNGVKTLFWLWMPLIIIILASIVLNGYLRQPPPNSIVLYDDESAYNYIQVVQDSRGYINLYLNEGQGVHSRYHPDLYEFGGTWDYFLVAPYFNPSYTPQQVESLLVIGLAAGTIPRQYQRVYGNIRMDGVEIDPDIIHVGELFFDMNAEKMPSLTAYAEDGRYVLRSLTRPYDVIAIDAYRPPYIPWHLTTVEFFIEIRDRLSDNGVVAINVGRTSTDRRLVDAMASTLMQVFTTVHAIDVPRSFNTILVATQTVTTADNLLQNLRELPADSPELLTRVMQSSLENLVLIQPSDIIFTDDRAPIENLVDSLVINFLLYGDIDSIR
ncbi:MAG: fused MFS/spermidine synthase [Phototrophicales bacterium]|nr:fused MFS/spermidine synthase [Phototrophicales bacterium]